MRRLFVFALLSCCLSAQAAIEDHGDYTLDTETGFIWPDLTVVGFLPDVDAALQPIGAFAGCRFPLQSEVADLLGKLGIPPQQTSCSDGYCGPIDPAYAEQLEDAIRLLGDTRDAALDAAGSTIDVAPDGAGWALGFADYGFGSNGKMWLRDAEYVNRATGLPSSDAQDVAFSDYAFSKGDGGHMLICDTWPITPVPSTLLDFEDVAPGTLAPFITKGYRISGDAIVMTDTSGNGNTILANTLCPGGGICDRSIVIEKADGAPLAIYDFASLATSGYEFNCYSYPCVFEISGTTTDGDLFKLNSVAVNDYELGTGQWLGLQSLTFTYETYTPQRAIDDVLLAAAQPSEIDFEPLDATNEMDPNQDEVTITIQINTKSIASGDAYDFDAADVIPNSLRVHSLTNSTDAASLLSPADVLTADYDLDGDTDYIFGFRTGDTGINCLDDDIVISGRTIDGRHFATKDVIVTTNCLIIADIDVDPFSSVNRVYPDDDYTVLVAFREMSVANGDPIDFDASRVDFEVKFGPSETPNTIAPIEFDIDGDGDNDEIFGFDMLDSGIACGDTELDVTGIYNGIYPDYSPMRLTATDTIVTKECVIASTCHP